MASPNIRDFLDSVVLITNHLGNTGTGFFVTRKVTGGCQIFLVTNKHVFHPDPAERAVMPLVHLETNSGRMDGSRRKQRITVSLKDRNRDRVREHLDSEIDVLAIEVTDIKINNPSFLLKGFDFDEHLVTLAMLKAHEVEAGDDVLMAGFPLGITQGTTNGSVLRQALIASRIGDSIEDQVKGYPRVLPAFLIDGGVVHGSSGSPVILKPTVGRITSQGIQLGDSPLLLLGILAETRFGALPSNAGKTLSYAGLGMAFDADTVRQVIDQFPRPATVAA